MIIAACFLAWVATSIGAFVLLMWRGKMRERLDKRRDVRLPLEQMRRQPGQHPN